MERLHKMKDPPEAGCSSIKIPTLPGGDLYVIASGLKLIALARCKVGDRSLLRGDEIGLALR